MSSNLTGSSAIPSALVPTVPGSLPTKHSKNGSATKSSRDHEREVICIDSDEEMGTLSSSSGSTFSSEAGTSSDQSLSGGLCAETLDTDQLLEEATSMMSDSETRKKALSAIKALASSWTKEPEKTVPLSGVDAGHATAKMSAQQGTSRVPIVEGQPPLLPKAQIAPSEVMLKKQEGHTPQEAAVAQALAGFVHFQRQLCKELHLPPTKQDAKGATNPRDSPVPILPAVGRRTFPLPSATSSGTLPVPSSTASSGAFSASTGTSLIYAPSGAISGIVPTVPCATGPITSTVPAEPVVMDHATSLEHSIATVPSVSTAPPKMATSGCRASSAPPAAVPETGQAKLVSVVRSSPELSTTTSVLSISLTCSVTSTSTPSIATFVSSTTSGGLPLSGQSVPPVSIAQFPSASSSSLSIADSAAGKSPLQALIERVHYQSTKVARTTLAYSPALSTASVSTTTTNRREDGVSPSTIMSHNQTRHA